MQRHVSQYYLKYKDYVRLMCPQTSYSAHVAYQLRDQIHLLIVKNTLRFNTIIKQSLF